MSQLAKISKLLPKTLSSNLSKFSTSPSLLREMGKDATDEAACNRAAKKADMLKTKTPIGKLEEQPNVHPAQEKDPLPEFPGGVNPKTGEVGGPKGPEPTRYGDWERKGRVTDF